MEIKGARRVESASVRRAARAGSGDAKAFAAEEIADSRAAAALTGASPIAAVDSILALQGIEDSTSSRSRNIDHGEQMLNLLDEIDLRARVELAKLEHSDGLAF